MATNELTSVDSPSWLNKWWRPFLWIILTPIVTVPLSTILFSVLAGYHEPQEVGLPSKAVPGWLFGEPTYPYEYFELVPTVVAFTLPGLLNLVPLLWALSTKSKVRIAGIVAGLLGLLRLSIPPIVLMLGFDRVTNAAGTSYFEYDASWTLGYPTPHSEIWFFGVLAWLGTLLVWAVFGWLTRGEEGPVTVATAHHSAR